MIDYSELKEQIKSVCDIVELIGQYVQLKKVGKNYVGLCPFHSERNPSFTVSPEKQMFHCFGCKKGGDIFTFWMEYHNVSFIEALKDLAERYNIKLKGISSEKKEEREKLFEANRVAALFFKKMLFEKEGKLAREYLKKRRIDLSLAKELWIGYAPDGWENLCSFLRERNIELEIASKAGLIVQRVDRDGYYDRFRRRIIFPIFDIRGRIVGFGGRIIGEGGPKYLNTPETPIFHKGSILYGLNFSYKAIRQKGKAILVEGYMDWIALWKCGIENSVATLGTALTQNHIRRLKGYADEVILIFDSDEAGKKAALRSFHLFANESVPAKVVILPEGHDPDSFLNRYGREVFLEYIEKNSKPILDFYLDMEIGNKKIEDEKKSLLLKNLLVNLNFIQDEITKGIYVSKISKKLGIKESLVWKALKSKRAYTEEIQEESSRRIGDLQILSLFLFHPEAIPKLIECDAESLIYDQKVKQIIGVIKERYSNGEKISAELIHDSLEDEDARALLREFMYKPFVVFSDEEVEKAISEIREKVKKKKLLEEIKQTIKKI